MNISGVIARILRQILLRQYVLNGELAHCLLAVAYRRTVVPHETVGHRHKFFSFYLTCKLNLRTDECVVQARSNDKWILWVVPPWRFHEWVAQLPNGVVCDITPFHLPHQLAA